MNGDLKNFIDIFSKEVEENNAAIFAGAGLSIPAGFVDWKELLRPLTEELGLDVDKERDLISIAQYHYNKHGSNRSRINQLLINEFCKKVEISENHKILARLPISTFWTTNYDDLIERSLEYENKIADVKHTVQQLTVTFPKRDAIVYKMHGDFKFPNDAVVTKDDYEAYHITRPQYLAALGGDLVSKTFLFIGFSFNDPNLDYILSRVRLAYNNNQRIHYCFMKKLKSDEFKTSQEYEYQELRQEYFTHDLLRFGIRTLLVDNYKEITDVLKKVDRRHKQHSVFISGTITKFNSLWKREKVMNFLRILTDKFIKNDYKIVTGLGQNVGTTIVEHIFLHNQKRYHDQLILRPFPTTDENSDSLWETWRRDMVSFSGVALFLFGNKIESGSNGHIVLADGMRKEFNIAKENGLVLLPVGATGDISKQLWQEVSDAFDEFYPWADAEFRNFFIQIGKTDSEPEKLADLIMKLFSKITSRLTV